MQLSNSQYQQQPQQDVYADVRPSYGNGYSQVTQDPQEFSLDDIQQRLGQLTSVAEPEVSTSADVKPSEQTLRMSYQREYTAERTKTASKLNTKTKVAIASYAIVVLALVIAVTLCSVNVGGAFGLAVSRNSIYSDELTVLDELNAATQEEDFADLAQRAADLGYIDAANSTNVMEYTELETRPAQNFHVESNWFDSLCDWLCGVFGG